MCVMSVQKNLWKPASRAFDQQGRQLDGAGSGASIHTYHSKATAERLEALKARKEAIELEAVEANIDVLVNDFLPQMQDEGQIDNEGLLSA